MKNKSKLNLEDFKKKAKSKDSSLTLNKIAGGVLGACHDVYCVYTYGGWGEYCVYKAQ